MKVVISCKNFNASDNLKETVEKKLNKLDKLFSSETTAKVMLKPEANKYKVEATITAKGTIFRAEEVTTDPYEGVDRVTDKLSRQMSKFKTKLQRKYKDNKAYNFAELPEIEDEQKEIEIVKRKKFELEPMTVEEAIMQMELLQHNFFVFLNLETDTVAIAYKRNNSNYGVLETSY